MTDLTSSITSVGPASRHWLNARSPLHWLQLPLKPSPSARKCGSVLQRPFLLNQRSSFCAWLRHQEGHCIQRQAIGNRLIVSGDLILNDPSNTTVLWAQSFCDAHDDQFINEVVVVGRLSTEAKVSDSNKSAARSLAVNRYNGKEEITDWFRLRGYGFSMEKLVSAPKGSLVSAHGCLEQKSNKAGDPYMEIKCRTVKVHSKGKGSAPNPAQGTSASGYDQEDFESSNEMPFDWSK